MSENYEDILSVAITMLTPKPHKTPAVIDETVTRLTILYPEVDTERLKADLLLHFRVRSLPYSFLEDRTRRQPWLDRERENIKWRFWGRYRDYLQFDRRMAANTVDKLGDLTDDVLDRLGNPRDREPFDRRGMVVGQVQSGKTANYTGLTAKAADAGYKLIIVLAGIHSSLRSQTQERIDEGFVGYNTEDARTHKTGNHWIGVGKRKRDVPAHSLTTSALNGDFKTNVADRVPTNIFGSDPVVIVVKKNLSILRNLIMWLANKGELNEKGYRTISDLPLLLIDDEADNASINVSKESISEINGLIRVLLSLFEQRSYVGYTATPFANIFIPLLSQADFENLNKTLRVGKQTLETAIGQELFPRDFIANIPPPSNYIGPDKIFGIGEPDDDEEGSHENVLPVVREIIPQSDENPDGDNYPVIFPNKHRKDDPLPEELPDSLQEAVLHFFLTCAARVVRGQGRQHSSMLIHISHFVRWQNKTGELVSDFLSDCRSKLALRKNSLEPQLKKIWEEEYEPVTARFIDEKLVDDPNIKRVSWEAVRKQLRPTLDRIKVRVVHGTPSRTGDPLHLPLDYNDFDGTGLFVIAVGGNKLSRGLTLEGLCVSYYLRASKMYDTLMQMGRWFGYRPGYVDLCRLFTSPEIISWYRHITLATEELRQEFDRMVRIGSTPEKYGLKIRSKPGVLQVTAANRMRGAWPLQLSFAGELMETYAFPRHNPDFIRANYTAAYNMVAGLGTPKPIGNQRHAWRDVPAEVVINFLLAYRTLQRNIEPVKLTDYISKQQPDGRLTNWTVILMEADNKKTIDVDFEIDGTITPVRTTLRNAAGSNPKPGEVAKVSTTEYVIPKAHIISPRHEYLDLDKKAVEEALEETQADRPAATIPSGEFVRGKRPASEALLLLYPLDPEPAGYDRAEGVPVMGYAISFPRLKKDKKVTYMGNAQLLDEFLNEDEDTIDAEAEDQVSRDDE
ncbi:Z1 domain-containing protein [Hymenobacter wooponensis]|uniref:Endonuclease n=1 Tax=Hymenobacter wooponensis TaxID=1525360 RepID=A0A4Z0MR18_9BACT|nr:Z1 domain-containing protein [Hymenobacter wooponensis]TGD81696.1 endonuclease [Hymenobacter wooponensis]